LKFLFQFISGVVCIIFGLTPFLPRFFFYNYGVEGTNKAMMISMPIIFVLGIGFLIFAVYWLFTKHEHFNPYRLMILTFASILAVMVSGSILIGLVVKTAHAFNDVSGMPCYILQGMMALMFLGEVGWRKRVEYEIA